MAILLPTLGGLTERQYQLFFLLQSLVARHRPDGLAQLTDSDLAEAAAALAASFETAAKGVLFEHTPQSALARSLMLEMRESLRAISEKAGRAVDQEAIPVLRCIERGARETHASTGGGETAYLSLVGRLLQQSPEPAGPQPAQEPSPSGIILP